MYPSSPKRTLLIAVLCTLAAVMMAVAATVNVPPIIAASGAHYGKGDVVTYTFDELRCVGGDIQYRSCGWQGTVTQPGQAPIDDVVYRDPAPTNVAQGLAIDALWSPRDKHSAYDIEQSDIWTTAIMTSAIAAVLAILFVIGAIIWWRRVFLGLNSEKNKADSSGNSNPNGGRKQKERESVDA